MSIASSQPLVASGSGRRRARCPACRCSTSTASITCIERDVTEAIRRVCASGRFVLGPDCEQLEASLASLLPGAARRGLRLGQRRAAAGPDGLRHGAGRRSADAQLHVLCHRQRRLAAGRQAGVRRHRSGHVQHRPSDCSKPPSRPATKAIMPVHLFGQCADMDGPSTRSPGGTELPVIEDAAQAIGAEFDGRRAGSLGAIGCFSFYPTKNLGGFGDGGMLTTRDDTLAERLRLLRGHGMQPRYYHQVVGINSRLDTLQAAVLQRQAASTSTPGPPPAAGQRRAATASCSREPAWTASLTLPVAVGPRPARLEPVRDSRAGRAARRAAQLSGRAARSAARSTTPCRCTCSSASSHWVTRRAACPRANGPPPKRWPCRSSPS